MASWEAKPSFPADHVRRASAPIAVGSSPFGIAITPDGKTAYVTNEGGSGSVTPITVATNTPGTPIAVGSEPYGIAITPAPIASGSSPAPPRRMGYCSVAGDTTPSGTPIPAGTFLNLVPDQPATTPEYAGAVPANNLQAIGISCDVPPGYVATGEKVGYYGHGDPGVRSRRSAA
jgi:YVTN family beta-propeller protein